MDSARTDAFTEATFATPNRDWGAGKVDMAAAIEFMTKVISDLMMNDSMGSWTGITSADTFNVYRADATALDGTFFGTCLQSGLATPDFTDTNDPSVGQAYAYYSTGVRNGIEGVIRIEDDGTLTYPSNPCL